MTPKLQNLENKILQMLFLKYLFTCSTNTGGASPPLVRTNGLRLFIPGLSPLVIGASKFDDDCLRWLRRSELI
jgi:hypothetical protein